MININEIIEILPHRYPILLIDKVIKLVPNESIIAIKNVSYNEPQFNGHFPFAPIMPGVLIIEAMAQASAILIAKSINVNADQKVPYLAGIDNARFRRVVIPGDVITISSIILKSKANIWKVQAIARVGEEIAVEGVLIAAMKDKNKSRS